MPSRPGEVAQPAPSQATAEGSKAARLARQKDKDERERGGGIAAWAPSKGGEPAQRAARGILFRPQAPDLASLQVGTWILHRHGVVCGWLTHRCSRTCWLRFAYVSPVLDKQ
eukprot:COSAG01_NODE_9137_length_2541_cov_4.615479_4_plen_111_part_01